MQEQLSFVNQEDARNYQLNRILQNNMQQMKKTSHTVFKYQQQMKNVKIDPLVFPKIKPRKPQVNKAYVDLFYNDTFDKRSFSYTFTPLKYQIHQKQFDVPTSLIALRTDKAQATNQKFGTCVASGKVSAKKHLSTKDGKKGGPSVLLDWKIYYYQQRSNYFYFYSDDSQLKPQFYVQITQKSLDKNLENMDSFALDEDLFIKKDQYSVEFRQQIEILVLLRSHCTVFAIDNQSPSHDIEKYIQGSNNLLLDLRKRKNNKNRNSNQYRQAFFSFITLLLAKGKKKKINNMQLFVPPTFTYIANIIPNKGSINILKTNMLPPRTPLMELHLNALQNSQIQQLVSSLRQIFPPLRNKAKRVLKINKSQLSDTILLRILPQLNWPLEQLDFSFNKLSPIAVTNVIETSKKLQTKIINLSYNQPISKIINDGYIRYIQNAPSLKVLKLRGCILVEGAAQWFFKSLKGTMWIDEIEIDYLPHYHKYLPLYLQDYEALISV